MNSKKVKISKKKHELTIEYKWFKLMAFFLVFFCLFWDGFLIAWYTILGSVDEGGDIVFFLFPLIHVAVGISLTYYTVALFVNKTTIKVNANSIDIKHAPLPWLGSKTVETKNIEQLYVKEKVNRGKNGTTYTYALYAKQKGIAKALKVLGGDIIGDAEDAQLIEQEMEAFLGIKDYQVRGEYQKEYKPLQEETPRKQVTEQNPIRINIKDLTKGAFLDYHTQSWEVIFETQYDWTRGDTDKLYQLINSKNETLLLFIQQDMGVLYTWIEEKVSYDQIEVQKAIFKDQLAARQHIDSGNLFTSNADKVSKIKQWRYTSEDKKKCLRILEHEEKDWSSFLGQKVDTVEFTNITPAGNTI
jgi:hypothetical protein